MNSRRRPLLPIAATLLVLATWLAVALDWPLRTTVALLAGAVFLTLIVATAAVTVATDVARAIVRERARRG